MERTDEEKLRIKGVIRALSNWLAGEELDEVIQVPLLHMAQASLDAVVYGRKKGREPEHIVSNEDPS